MTTTTAAPKIRTLRDVLEPVILAVRSVDPTNEDEATSPTAAKGIAGLAMAARLKLIPMETRGLVDDPVRRGEAMLTAMASVALLAADLRPEELGPHRGDFVEGPDEAKFDLQHLADIAEGLYGPDAA